MGNRSLIFVCVILRAIDRVPINASALSDARFGAVVEAGVVLFARSIKPLEGSRPWLRRTRPAMEIEWWETAV